MKRHMGIGRRLAPLLDNDRRTAELLYALILSLPGSPVIYYGDELLMGDNIYLGDRDSVRTPMQWSPDRNGGFSEADFAQLYLPPLIDPVYGFAVAQRRGPQFRNQGSFLHWLRRLLTERRALPVMGVGEMEVLPCANPSVLSYVRSGSERILTAPPAKSPAVSVRPVDRRADWARSSVLARTVPAGNESEADEVVRRHQAVLCVHNLSRFAQPAELALAKWAGSTPYEVLGRVPFPAITEEPYTITLPPYGFLSFDLVPEERPVQEWTRRADQALRTLTEAWLSSERSRRSRRRSSCAPRSCGPDVRASSTSWRTSVAASPTSSSACAGWLTSSTSYRGGGSRPRPARRRSGTRGVHRSCATPNWDPCCWPPSVVWSHSHPSRWCVTTRMPPCSTAVTTATSWSSRGSPTLHDPDVDFMMGIEDAGFNHVATPLVRWVVEGHDLGHAGAVGRSLRRLGPGADVVPRLLRRSGGTPEAAGGDFGSEARALGVMTAPW